MTRHSAPNRTDLSLGQVLVDLNHSTELVEPQDSALDERRATGLQRRHRIGAEIDGDLEERASVGSDDEPLAVHLGDTRCRSVRQERRDGHRQHPIYLLRRIPVRVPLHPFQDDSIGVALLHLTDPTSTADLTPAARRRATMVAWL